MSARPLAGHHVVTTRDRPGRLDSRLARLGADVINVPLISIDSPLDGGARLRSSLDGLAAGQWLVVTSQHGARAVGDAAAAHPHLHLAAVGSSTAEVLACLAGRAVDVVPDRQSAADLVASMPHGSGRVVVAQADRADAAIGDGLRSIGYTVEVVIDYRTTLRPPSPAERRAALGADAIAFASGSAAESWVSAFGVTTAPIMVAIGPTTAEVARRCGLQVDRVATDHHVEGLVDAIVTALS